MKTCLVTGASSEIGIEIVKKMVSVGYFVFAHYKDNVPELSEEFKSSVSFLKADFSDNAEFENFINELETKIKNLDLIINCAGLHEKNLREDLGEYEKFQQVSRINIFVPIHLFKKLKSKMQNTENPLVIFISSYYSHGGGDFDNIYYSATKTSLSTISRIIAKENSPIRSNLVTPGYVNTDSYRKGRTKEEIDEDKNGSLVGDFVKVGDVVNAIEFIIDNKSINATEIRVDGGLDI